MTRAYVQQLTYEEMKEKGKLFKSIRKSLGLNLDEMSKLVGTFRTTLSKWEKGLIIPREDMYFLEQRFRDLAKTKNVS
jgi:transcriptional regulator with XRE-family HTH domain